MVYLDHVISELGVSMDPTKISSILKWPISASLKAVRGFLGLIGYYRRSIKDYGKISQSLTQLLKKEQGGFWWDLAAQQAFLQLQEAITSTPVLPMPNFKKPFLLECDASGRGLGAVLMQDKHPIAYFSKALSN